MCNPENANKNKKISGKRKKNFPGKQKKKVRKTTSNLFVFTKVSPQTFGNYETLTSNFS